MIWQHNDARDEQEWLCKLFMVLDFRQGRKVMYKTTTRAMRMEETVAAEQMTEIGTTVA